MDLFKLLFGILLIIFGVLILVYQNHKSAYKTERRYIDSPVQITSAAIISIIAGILLIITSTNI